MLNFVNRIGPWAKQLTVGGNHLHLRSPIQRRIFLHHNFITLAPDYQALVMKAQNERQESLPVGKCKDK